MSISKVHNAQNKAGNKVRYDWPIMLFLLIVPVLALVLTPLYLYFYGISWSLGIFAVVFAVLTNLSITAGYHRLYSHRSYEAHPIVRFFLLFIGSSAFQGSCLKWSADHRIHHNKMDTDDDPYNIHRGFWFAHMGWLFLKDHTNQNPTLPDLKNDWMVQFQHKYYIPCSIVAGFIFPTAVGALFGEALGGFLIAGILRVALTQQSTFFVNSLCHTFGRKPYSASSSARDSLFVAVLTHGEGYHNYHHRFQIDYRNGIKWYQWDPTKWTIQSFQMLGLAKKLRTISNQEILKARLQTEALRIKSKGFSDEKVQQLRDSILEAQANWKRLKEEYAVLKIQYRQDFDNLKSQYQHDWHHQMETLKLEMKTRQIEFQASMKLWKAHLAVPNLAAIN